MKSVREQLESEGWENYQLLLDKLSEIQQIMQQNRKPLCDVRVTEKVLRQMDTVIDIIKLYPDKR